jgi:hypothetical protein
VLTQQSKFGIWIFNLLIPQLVVGLPWSATLTPSDAFKWAMKKVNLLFDLNLRGLSIKDVGNLYWYFYNLPPPGRQYFTLIHRELLANFWPLPLFEMPTSSTDSPLGTKQDESSLPQDREWFGSKWSISMTCPSKFSKSSKYHC